jgi:cell division protein FtsB
MDVEKIKLLLKIARLEGQRNCLLRENDKLKRTNIELNDELENLKDER